MKNDMRNELLMIKLNFGNTYEKCAGHKDDRLLFKNKVDVLLAAVIEFEHLEVNSTLIKIGFDKIYSEKFEQLKDLEKSLKKRGMI